MRFLIWAIFIFLAACRTHEKGNSIPSFSLLLLDSTTHLNTSQIKDGAPIVLVYFSPDCEHCQHETESILHAMDSLKDVKFYFITNDDFSRLKVFDKYYKIYKYKNITLCYDYSFSFIRLFKNVAPPYTVLYDEDRQLRAVFNNQVKAEDLISFIQKM
jgi:thiol-disulfide isomerase/thioredoxin